MQSKLFGTSVLLKKALKVGVVILGACSLGVVNMPASPLFGSFTISGQITVTQDAGTGLGHIMWKSDVSPFTLDNFTLSASNLNNPGPNNENGQNGIADLNNAAQPVGVGFADLPFISFLVNPGVIPNLDLNFINVGPYLGVPGNCSGLGNPASAGQFCTLPGSPFGFVNSGSNTSSASFTFQGDTAEPGDADLSHWIGQFSTNFNTSFQTVLAPFLVPGGAASVTNTFAGTVTITVTPAPEPASLIMIGTGLIGLATLLRRRLSK